MVSNILFEQLFTLRYPIIITKMKYAIQRNTRSILKPELDAIEMNEQRATVAAR